MDQAAAARAASRTFWASWIVEAAFGFLIVTPMLFVVQLGSAAPALSYAIICVYSFRSRRDAIEILLARWPLLIFLAFALFSTVWSDYRALTLKHALELGVTAIGGMLLSGSRRPFAVLTGVWAAFGLFMLVSFAFGHSTGVGLGAGADSSAFAGLNGAKNLFGMTAALAALLSLFLLTYSGRSRSWLGVLGAAAVLLVELYLTWVARSAGAVIAITLGTAAFLVTASFKLMRPGLRAIACGFLAVVLGAGGAIGYAFANSVTATILDVFHKDPTLTGREYLWYRAHDFIHDKPLLGRGFEAFWVQGNTDAEGLWQYGGITGRSGFNFHNTLIELLIHFGWIGTILTLLIFLIAFVFLIRRCIREPSLAVSFYFAFVVFELARSPFESLIPASFDFGTLLLFAALGFGFGIPEAQAPIAAVQPARRPAYRTPAGAWSARARMRREAQHSA